MGPDLVLWAVKISGPRRSGSGVGSDSGFCGEKMSGARVCVLARRAGVTFSGDCGGVTTNGAGVVSASGCEILRKALSRGGGVPALRIMGSFASDRDILRSDLS